MPLSSNLPVAYLPGASGRSSVWRPIAERLARRREPILFDYPGLGDAPADASITSLSDLCSVVLAALPARSDLVAMSMGGALALRLAIEHPARIRRLVLVTTAGGVDVERLGALDWRPSFRQKRPDAPMWFVDDRTDFTDRLPSVAAPTLLVFGGGDLIAPVAVGEFLRERLPFAKLEVIAGATHDLEEEYPDLLASLIEAHFRL
jgi:pimeloyl-ACP methyl ester carboxylesterase